jgi:hypothetical protein
MLYKNALTESSEKWSVVSGHNVPLHPYYTTEKAPNFLTIFALITHTSKKVLLFHFPY